MENAGLENGGPNSRAGKNTGLGARPTGVHFLLVFR